MPRRGRRRGMRMRGGLAKRVRLNYDNNDLTVTSPGEEISSTVNDNMVASPAEEISSTVDDIAVVYPVEELSSTTNDITETCPTEEVSSTVDDNTDTYPIEEITSTMNEETIVIDLTQDNQLEASPTSSSSDSNNPAHLSIALNINSTSSAQSLKLNCSTSQNGASSSSGVTSQPEMSKGRCEGNEENECPVCLHPCVHPAKLPCSHVFCYLCIKGIARIGQPCPMCRSPIPHYYTVRPQLVTPSKPCTEASEETENQEDEEKYHWFYQGRNGGWWQFEQRMSDEIEENHNLGVSCFDMMICGSLYVIDTVGCVQYPKNFPMRRRRLLRDLPSHINRIGIAGIHNAPAQNKQ